MEHFYARLPRAMAAIPMLVWMSCPTCTAQNLEGFWSDITRRIREKEYLRMAGGLELESRLNVIDGLTPRADGFVFRGHANLLLDVVGIKIPFSVAFSDGDLTYRLPAYAFYGASPNYRWITLHLGDRAMNFSPYTLAGHHFRGIGVELKPGKFYFAAMSGRLRKARAEEAGSIQPLEGAYRRDGWGIKTGYDDGKNKLLFILFGAKDNPGSLELPDSSLMAPQENLIAGLQGKTRLGNFIQLELDVARSAFTRDRRSPEISGARMAGLYQPRYSSGYHDATRFRVNFTPKNSSFHLTYERVDPGYRTLGALFFNNDQENISTGFQLPLFEKKVSFSANVGVQRNGLEAGTANTFRRFVGSFDCSAALSSKLQVQAGCSNFSTTNRYHLVTLPIVQVDSIVLVQTNFSLQLGASYLGGAARNSVFNVLLTCQTAQAIQNDQVLADQHNTFYAGMISHTWRTSDDRWVIASSGMAHFTRTTQRGLFLLGPALNIGRTLLKKQLRLGFNGAYSIMHSAGVRSGGVLDLQSESAYNITRQQTLVARASHIWSDNLAGSGFSDWNARLIYRLTFK